MTSDRSWCVSLAATARRRPVNACHQRVSPTQTSLWVGTDQSRLTDREKEERLNEARRRKNGLVGFILGCHPYGPTKLRRCSAAARREEARPRRNPEEKSLHVALTTLKNRACYRRPNKARKRPTFVACELPRVMHGPRREAADQEDPQQKESNFGQTRHATGSSVVLIKKSAIALGKKKKSAIAS